MQSTVTLRASAKYGFGGKQYIARITGRDQKFTFAREFVGVKSGKRREDSEYETDEPGLYVECDIDRKGNKCETYYIIFECPTRGMTKITSDRTDMMGLAKRLDNESSFDYTREGLVYWLSLREGGDPDAMIQLSSPLFDLPAGEVRRGDLVNALRTALETYLRMQWILGSTGNTRLQGAMAARNPY